MSWFTDYVVATEKTDQFIGKHDHLQLLAAGLMGEAGSVLSELKKEERELNAYPEYRRRMEEELGDFLWYFVRLVSVAQQSLLAGLELDMPSKAEAKAEPLPLFLRFGTVAVELAGMAGSPVTRGDLTGPVHAMWALIRDVAHQRRLRLEELARLNLVKIRSRWPEQKIYAPLFDDNEDEEEQLPRILDVEFRPRGKAVVLRCNGINFGDRVTDNIQDPDGYRFHDIFHFAYAVHLGWSPVVRALLKCKRKGKPELDEGQDAARATIVEEAVSAIVFSRAKQLAFFDGKRQVDYDLLKVVSEHVRGYEVDKIPLWQWERAILDGFDCFRKLVANKGGYAQLDLRARKLNYHAR